MENPRLDWGEAGSEKSNRERRSPGAPHHLGGDGGDAANASRKTERVGYVGTAGGRETENGRLELARADFMKRGGGGVVVCLFVSCAHTRLHQTQWKESR